MNTKKIKSIHWKNYKLDLSNNEFVSYKSNGDLLAIKSQSPIIFLNGLSCTDQHFEKMIQDFHSKNIPLITLDYRGHFASSKMSIERISVASIVSDVSSIIKKHKLKNITLIGHSMGGNIALEVAAKEKKNVSKVICIAGPASQVADSIFHSNFVDFILPVLEKYQNAYPIIQKLLWKNMQNPLISKIIHYLGFNTEKISSNYIQRYIDDAIKIDFNVFKKLFFEMMNLSIMPVLSIIEQPILFIRGTMDHIVPSKEFDRFVAASNKAHVKTIKDGSHVPQSEFPDETHKIIYEFLDS